MTAAMFVFCDKCNPNWVLNHPGTWKGTVGSALRYGWHRPNHPGSGGGSGTTQHFCPKCKP